MKHSALLIALVCLLSSPVLAQEGIDYSYADAVFVNQDGAGDDFTGMGLRASWAVAPQFYVAGELLLTSADDLDRTDIGVGAGYHMPLNRTTDFFAQIDFLSVDTDAGDDDGLRLGAGVRSLVAKQLELRGGIQYVDVGDGELVVNLGAQYMITPSWAGFLELSEGDDYGGYLLGARFAF